MYPHHREDVDAVFARLQTISSLPPADGPDDPDARRGELTDILRRHAGYGGAYFMVSGPTAMRALLTLWSTEEDARAASDRTRAAAGDLPRPVIDEDVVYEVTEDEPGPAGDAEPTVAAVATFDGPFSDAGRAAMDRIHHDRVIPAVRALPGTVRLLFLWDRLSRSMRGLHLATDAGPLDAARAPRSTRPTRPRVRTRRSSHRPTAWSAGTWAAPTSRSRRSGVHPRPLDDRGLPRPGAPHAALPPRDRDDAGAVRGPPRLRSSVGSGPGQFWRGTCCCVGCCCGAAGCAGWTCGWACCPAGTWPCPIEARIWSSRLLPA